MRKGQVLFEFIVFGLVIFILFLVITCKFSCTRIFCYINTEHNIKKSTILSGIKYTPVPVIHKSRSGNFCEDKVLITTEYFSYYIPINIEDMAKKCGQYSTQKELLAVIFQVANQLKLHNINYDNNVYNEFNKSLTDYVSLKSRHSRLEKQLDIKVSKFESELLKQKSPIADEGALIISKFIAQIKNLSKTY